MIDAVSTFRMQAQLLGYPFIEEYSFAADRKWRFDFAWPNERIAVEVHGAVWKIGRHQRPEGFRNDLEKLRAALLEGWLVLPFTSEEVQRGIAIRDLERAFSVRFSSAGSRAAGRRRSSSKASHR